MGLFSNADFNLFLKEYGITENDLNIWMEQMDVNNLVEVESINYYKKKSQVHGLGLFANKNFKKGDHLGIVMIGDKRCTLGRWTNHEKNNNVEFSRSDYDDYNEIKVVCIASVDISRDQELLVNYRNHNKLL